jgi:hypothetical protein
LESIVTGPDDEWPIHPSDEWPIRPDPKPGDAREADHANGQTQPPLPRIYVAPDETVDSVNRPNTRRSRKQTIKVVAKPRRALISDDEQPVIVTPDHSDNRDSNDDSWPVLPQKDPESAKPDPTELKLEPYRPHLPLPEPSTWSQRVRRIAWILMVFQAVPLAITVLARIASPHEPGLAEVQIIGAIGCAICFFVAYYDQIFLEGDN